MSHAAPPHLDDHVPVAQVVLGVRLRILRCVETQTFQVRPERVEVDVRGGGVENRPLFGEDVAERVVELLELRRGRLRRAALAPHPHPTLVPQGFESALSRHLDPVHPARRFLAPSGAGVKRCAAACLQEGCQALLHSLRVLPDTGDLRRIVHAQHDQAAFGVRERTRRPADGGQVSECALELRVPAFAGPDAVQDLRPLHAVRLPWLSGSLRRETRRRPGSSRPGSLRPPNHTVGP